ncbi:MAG TPA: hypothetical protein VL326_14015 [Kofleriaceae bacterium]|nr:hypothetical protein [Kofleriaceae bacterium]
MRSMGRLAFAFVLGAPATASAQGVPTAPDAPVEPAASEPTTSAEPAPAPAAPAAQGLPAYPEEPKVYAPPPAPPADPGRATIDTGASVTTIGNNFVYAAWLLEGGYTIPIVPRPYFVRARAGLALTGETINSDLRGKFNRYAVGAEAGACGSFVCGFVDVDVAYQHANIHDIVDGDIGDEGGPHFYSRVGIDLGPRRIHARAAIEVGRWRTLHDPSVWKLTGGLFIGAGVRL